MWKWNIRFWNVFIDCDDIDDQSASNIKIPTPNHATPPEPIHLDVIASSNVLGMKFYMYTILSQKKKS